MLFYYRRSRNSVVAMTRRRVVSMSLSDILREIQDELVKRDQAHQEVQTAMRKATRLSKQAIFMVHKDKLSEAKNTLAEAEKIFAKLDQLSLSYPDLSHTGSVDAALQEYTEAQVLLALVDKGCFIGFRDVNVRMTSYVLGLADVVGELRRRVLDLLRKGNVKEAEMCLEFMETIYAELTNVDEVHFLIPGLRRKCDTARHVVEATRSDVTGEVRRSALESSIRELKNTIEAKRKE